MNKEYMDSRAKHIRFLVGSAMHKVMETICWCTPSITKHEGSEAMGAHEIHLQSTTEGVTHLYEAIDALQDACRRFSFFEVVQTVLSEPVLKFYTAETRTEETFEERVLRETKEQVAAQTPSVVVKAKPEPQPPAPQPPKPASARRAHPLPISDRMKFFAGLAWIETGCDKGKVVRALKDPVAFAREKGLESECTPKVIGELTAWTARVKDVSIVTESRAWAKEFKDKIMRRQFKDPSDWSFYSTNFNNQQRN